MISARLHRALAAGLGMLFLAGLLLARSAFAHDTGRGAGLRGEVSIVAAPVPPREDDKLLVN
jgi:hypothetical protein